jgi:hypothetical protein
VLKKRFEIYYIIGAKIADWIEKIFRRKELADLKDDVQEKAAQIKRLITGETMHLGQHERRMILRAIEAPTFKAIIEEPGTKAFVRIIYRQLREKLKMSIKKEDHNTTLEVPTGSPGTKGEEREK